MSCIPVTSVFVSGISHKSLDIKHLRLMRKYMTKWVDSRGKGPHLGKGNYV